MRCDLRELVRTPADRAKGDLAILCPKMYRRCADRYMSSTSCAKLRDADVVEFRRSFFVWPQQLHCLPFCRVRKGHRHRFGSLSLHVKAKTLFPKVADWSSVKFRPLVSYKQHHWKQLFRITCQAIDFVQRSVAPGFSVLSADALHQKISAVNHTAESASADRISVHVDDIQDFFTCAPRRDVMASVLWATNELRHRSGHYFICVPRIGCHNTPSWLYADSPGMTSWRTLKKRKVLTPTTSAWSLPSNRYYCLAIVDLPFIVAQDWKYAYFLFGSEGYAFENGFAHGSPISGEVANLFACVKEHRFLANLPHLLRQNMRLHLCAVRWMDDRLLVWRSSLMRAILDGLLDDGFYTAACKLKHTSDNAFIGSRVVISHSRICTIPWSVYHDAALTDPDGRAPRLIAQQSFGSRRVQVKGLIGDLVRILDFAIGTSSDLHCCLYMQLSELRPAGYSTAAMYRLIWHLHSRMPFLSLPSALRNAAMPSLSLRLFCEAKLQSLALHLGRDRVA